ncbi:hypothetical protein J2848_001552 [Azospirillum lipoferum]|uniref:Uncharacterized protein n=1 Tax=Azospirillum lipoferum TaxID=193 RepID=A0A5A9GU08_AZOLI|nr:MULTISPECIES: hypothetical protein [Azospirillum]KAA0597961.1 hypothetical protein FZ942_02370 [Azospirillum lipoferum]MCP1609893.1 hypothetical protein [Azospirillum lipoferum]MDW5534614.1 hypothetical protein [Azospirillum sp. NL1]
MTILPTTDTVATADANTAAGTGFRGEERAANVIQFCRARFTPDDLDAFAAVAEPKIRDGHWVGVLRESGRDHDRLLVLLPEVDRPVFRFERDAKGRYSLSFHDRSGWYGIGAGDSAADCLSIWRPRRPRTP